MTLPAGTWDLGTFDADVNTDFVGLSPWTTAAPPIGAIVSAGIYEFDTTNYAIVALDPVTAVTAAASIKTDSPATPASAFTFYVGHYAAYVAFASDGIYVTLDGSTFTKVVTQDMASAFHEVFCTWDSGATTITVNLDGTDVYILTSTTGLIDVGGPVSTYQFFSSPGYHTQIKYMVVASTAIPPAGGGGGGAVADFHVGATAVTFKIDEYANYPSGLTDAQILVHYKAGKGIPL